MRGLTEGRRPSLVFDRSRTNIHAQIAPDEILARHRFGTLSMRMLRRYLGWTKTRGNISFSTN